MGVCIHEIIRLILTKMKIKIKNRSLRYDTNRPRFRHEPNYSKYKKCLSMMMVMYIKQYLSNMWCLIHEKLSNTKAELKNEKSVYHCLYLFIYLFTCLFIYLAKHLYSAK